MSDLKPTHVNARGEVHMVDVAAKAVTARRAVARSRVAMADTTRDAVRSGMGMKGDVEATVRLAGIMAAKRAHELIPLCHSVALTSVAVDVCWTDEGAELTATAEAMDRTGVEMEAMVAASVAALALYDMVKGIERGVTVTAVELLEKSGGRSGRWTR